MGYLSKNSDLAKRMRERLEYKQCIKQCRRIIARLKKSGASVKVTGFVFPGVPGALESEGFGVWQDDSMMIVSIYPRQKKRYSPERKHDVVPEVEPLDIW